jgi:hypothetical protein
LPSWETSYVTPFFYECPACHVTLKPKPGDCCVFCSYGDKRYPPVQDTMSRFGAS